LEVPLKIFTSLILMLLPLVSLAAPQGQLAPEAIQDELNRTPYGQHVQLGDLEMSRKPQVLQAVWDFSKQGGATGDIELLDAKTLKRAGIPVGAIVKNCAIHVLGIPTSSGSATLKFSTGFFDGDIKAATGKASFATSDSLIACNTTGGSVSSWIKLPGYSDRYSPGYSKEYTPKLTIGTAALDSGKISVFIEYLLNR
jgi:hypothetical protein